MSLLNLRKGDRWLYFTDLHEPAAHPEALPFIKNVIREYKISSDRIIFGGDLVDNHWASVYKKSPDLPYSSTGEISLVRDKIRQWSELCPLLTITKGNHDDWIVRKSSHDGTPLLVMRSFEDIFKIPDTWHCVDFTKIRLAIGEMTFEHGSEFSGENSVLEAIKISGTHTAIGHIHTRLGYRLYRTKYGVRLGINGGSLIDPEHPAFGFTKKHKLKSVQGAVVLLDGGRRIECPTLHF